MSPIGSSIFILMLSPKIENNISMNIKITANKPTIEIIFGINFETYNV